MHVILFKPCLHKMSDIRVGVHTNVKLFYQYISLKCLYVFMEFNNSS